MHCLYSSAFFLTSLVHFIYICTSNFWTDRWCNGNTTVFGAVFQGSNPCRSTFLIKTAI